jgi:hypothetical protein
MFMWLRNDCVGVLRYRSGTPVSGVAAGEPPRRLGSVGQNDPAPSATKRLWTKSPKHVYVGNTRPKTKIAPKSEARAAWEPVPSARAREAVGKNGDGLDGCWGAVARPCRPILMVRACTGAGGVGMGAARSGGGGEWWGGGLLFWVQGAGAGGGEGVVGSAGVDPP